MSDTVTPPVDATAGAAAKAPDQAKTDVSTGGMAPGLVSVLRKSAEASSQNVERIESTMKDIDARKPPEPPKLEKPPNTSPTGFMESFGSAAMGLAGLGSLFTRRPMTNALNAGAAVMNAFHKNDLEAAEQAYKKWQADSDYAIKMHNFQHEAYEDAINKGKTNVELGKALMTARAAQFQDEVMLSYLNRGDWQGALAIHQGRDPLASSMANARASLENLNIATKIEAAKAMRAALAIPDSAQRAAKVAEVQQYYATLEHVGETPAKASAAANMEYVRADGTKGSGAVQQQPDGRWTTLDGVPVTPTKKIGTGAAAENAEALNTRAIAAWKEKHPNIPEPTTFAEKAEFEEMKLAMKANDEAKRAGQKALTAEQMRAQFNPLSEDATNMFAKIYLLTGQYPPFGASGTNARAFIDNAAARIAKEEGKTVEDYLAHRAEFKADQSTLAFMTKMNESVRSAEDTMLRNIKTVEELMNSGVGTPAGPVVNRWLQAGRKATGDADVAAFNTAIGVVQGEFAKIISGGAASAAETSVAAQEKAKEWLDAVQSPEALKAQIGVAVRDAANRRAALEASEKRIKENIRGVERAGAPAEASSSFEQQAKSTFGSYEPDIYEYGINPATGRFGRRRKN